MPPEFGAEGPVTLICALTSKALHRFPCSSTDSRASLSVWSVMSRLHAPSPRVGAAVHKLAKVDWVEAEARAWCEKVAICC